MKTRQILISLIMILFTSYLSAVTITDFVADYGSPTVIHTGSDTNVSGNSYNSIVKEFNFEVGKSYTVSMDLLRYATNHKSFYIVSRNGTGTSGTFETIFHSTTISDGEHVSVTYTPSVNKSHIQLWHDDGSSYNLVFRNFEIVEQNGDTVNPIITLEGNLTVTLNVGDTYVDSGATANDDVDGNISLNINTNSTVNPAVAGTYTVKYNVSDAAGNAADEVVRTVIVQDIHNYITDFVSDYGTPTLTSTGNEMNMSGNSYNSIVKAYNFQAGSTYRISMDLVSYATITKDFYIVSRNGTSTSGTFDTIYHSTTISDGEHVSVDYTPSVNKSHVQIWHNNGSSYNLVFRNFEIVDLNGTTVTSDTVKPVITLLGTTPVVLNVGDTYVDEGAEATDNVDGNISTNISVNNQVNTLQEGNYTVSYNVSDSAGNVADEVIREVRVLALPDNNNSNQMANFVTDYGSPSVSVSGNTTIMSGDSYNSIVKPYNFEAGKTYLVSMDLVSYTTDSKNFYIVARGNAGTAGTFDTIYHSTTISDGTHIAATYTPTQDRSHVQIWHDESSVYNMVIRDFQVVEQNGTSASNTAPVITLLGDANVTLIVGDTYTDAGATANDAEDGNITANIVVNNPVDTSTVGTYTVTYDVIDSNGTSATQVVRTVHVTAAPVVNTAPVITLLGDANVTVVQNSTYTDAGATANDAEDGNISADIVVNNPIDTSTVGTYTITYDVTDSNGTSATQVVRSINVTPAPVVNTAPVITLLGDANVTVVQNSTYTDAGATANDAEDGNITANIVVNNSVNTSIVGSYTVTYDVTDSNGTAATQVVRTVNVTATPVVNTTPVITLLGNATITIDKGTIYNDAGATANDVEDGNITANIVTVNPVDTATAGIYIVTYNVDDSNGSSATEVTRSVTVVDNNTTITGRIVDESDVVIPNVQIKVFPEGNSTALDINVTSDMNGLFTMNLNEDQNFTLQFKATGFATQVLPISTPAVNQSANFDITMIHRGVAQAVSATTNSILVGNDGAQVSVNPGMFTTPSGTIVSDNIQVTITPVDISTAVGVESFPGNFAGIQEGATTPSPIVSYGTVEYQFTRNGEVLQLASGQTATIEIPIYTTTHPDGTAIVLGDIIPLWSLDEETGNWSQDGNGTVVASGASPTGFALRATVSHFTWWNCDVTYNSGRVRVTVLGDGDGYAYIYGETNASVGWRSSSVNTNVNLNQQSAPLPVPSTGTTCISALIHYRDGTSVQTSEVCQVFPGGITTDIQLGFSTDPLKIGLSPDMNISAEIGNAVPTSTVTPLSRETSVTYSIISGALPSGITLSSKPVLTGTPTKAILSGTPTVTGTFTAAIQGTDVDGNTDTIVVQYNVAPDTTRPIIHLKGFSYQELSLGTTYIDAGATATDNVDGNLTTSIIVTNNVDTSVAGYYTVKYNVHDAAGNSAYEVTRYVNIIDLTCEPYIHIFRDENDLLYGDPYGQGFDGFILEDGSLEGGYTGNDAGGSIDVDLIQGIPYVEYGATAFCQNLEQELEIIPQGDVNSSELGLHQITYLAINLYTGEVEASADRLVHVILSPDTEPPVVTVNNDANMTLQAGSTYIEYNATVTDNRDVNLTAAITSADINTSLIGTQYVTYEATDSYGNTGSATRQVNIVPASITALAYANRNAYLNTPITIQGGYEYSGLGTLSFSWMEGATTLAQTLDFDYTPSSIGIHTLVLTVHDQYEAISVDSMDVNVTIAPDTTPNTFFFADLYDVNLSTVQEGSIYVFGINTATPISIIGGEYSLDNGATWTSTAGTVTNNTTVKVRHTSSASYLTPVDTNLSVGSVSDVFTSTTKASGNAVPVPSINYDTAPVVDIEMYGGQIPFAEAGGTDDTGIEFCQWKDENDENITSSDINPPQQELFSGYGCFLNEHPLFNTSGSSLNVVYTLLLRDINGNIGTQELNITVLPNNVPVVDIGGNRTIMVNDELNLTATASDADGEELTYQWMYGLKDGQTIYGAGSSLEFSHIFDTVGVYTVSFTAYDTHSVSTTTTIDINVTDAVASAYVCPATSTTEDAFTDTFITNSTSDINWSQDKFSNLTVAQLETAFNVARAADATTSNALLKMPTQTVWDGMSESEKALYLINSERCARGLVVFEGVEPAVVTSPAQTYAQYLSDNATPTSSLSHTADGRTPFERLTQEAGVVVNSNADFFSYGENLAFQAVASSVKYPTLYHPTAKSVYAWMYEDAGSAYGHRNFLLAKGLAENSGKVNQEGLIGLGQSTYKYENSGFFWTRVYTVLNGFDPKDNWDNNLSHIIEVDIQASVQQP